MALEVSALGAARAGYTTEAVAQASEGLRLARDTWQQQTAAGNLLAALAMANALQGREQDCRRYAEEASDVIKAVLGGFLRQPAAWQPGQAIRCRSLE